jgi:hypothetical protein
MEVIMKIRIVLSLTFMTLFGSLFCGETSDLTVNPIVKIQNENEQKEEEKAQEALQASLNIYVPKEEPYEMVYYFNDNLPALPRQVAIYIHGVTSVPRLPKNK